jgi:hypothetical protein
MSKISAVLFGRGLSRNAACHGPCSAVLGWASCRPRLLSAQLARITRRLVQHFLWVNHRLAQIRVWPPKPHSHRARSPKPGGPRASSSSASHPAAGRNDGGQDGSGAAPPGQGPGLRGADGASPPDHPSRARCS